MSFAENLLWIEYVCTVTLASETILSGRDYRMETEAQIT